LQALFDHSKDAGNAPSIVFIETMKHSVFGAVIMSPVRCARLCLPQRCSFARRFMTAISESTIFKALLSFLYFRMKKFGVAFLRAEPLITISIAPMIVFASV
jgi:hypothetical protein